MIHRIYLPPGRPSDGATIRIIQGATIDGEVTFVFVPVNTVNCVPVAELPIPLMEFVLLRDKRVSPA